MQEKYLSRRTIHFLQGQMVWECSRMARGQGDFVDDHPIWDLNLRTPLKTFREAFGRSYICPWLDIDGEEEDDDEEECNATTLAGSTTTIDLRGDALRNDTPPILLDHDSNEALYKFINAAINSTIYHVWYEAVSSYSTRRLTFSFDKLPALAGIASRVHDITKDDYLAGHWRRELERSLFWRVETESGSGHPGRVKEYRAPSWSWASVNASTKFQFAEIDMGDVPTTIQIVEASVDVDGENPFGCITHGTIVLRADTIRASWRADLGSWLIESKGEAYEETQFDDLTFVSSENISIGVWKYDDIVHGVLPGPQLTENTTVDEALERSVPSGYFGAVHWSNMRIHGADADDASTLWKRATYVPEQLLLVKGRTTHRGRSVGDAISTDVLVLAKTEGPENEYKRVGVGNLATWDNDIASSEVLTVV